MNTQWQVGEDRKRNSYDTSGFATDNSALVDEKPHRQGIYIELQVANSGSIVQKEFSLRG